MSYAEFLQNKVQSFEASGIKVTEHELNPSLFPFQKFIVSNALAKGRYAIFADCGLGKTFMQLEWAKHVQWYTGKAVLILAPLAVSGQTIEEGKRFNIEVSPWKEGGKIQIANYEQLENIDCSNYSGIVLDESSILKNFEGQYRTLIIERFKNTPYKLACTATPSPNDPMELGNHAEFLNVMSRAEMLAMYFVHDGGDTSKWRIKGHAVSLFYKWVSSWAVMLATPADIGFKADGYNLPSLNLIEKTIVTPKRENGQLFNAVAVSATNFNQELRLTRLERMTEAARIVNESQEPFIVWVNQNEEADLLRTLIPDAVEVRGTDTPEVKEKRLLGFAKGEFRVLITKKKIAQFGLNYQHCNNQVFASLDFSFEGLYQAIRRSYRFGQTKPVNIYLITTDTMQNVADAIRQKENQFNEMRNQMISHLDQSDPAPVVSLRQTKELAQEGFILRNGDCIQLAKDIDDDSIHFSVFSPPFADLYTYSDHLEDMGNSRNYDEFFQHFEYLVRSLYRIMIPGRNVAVHCMDLPIQKGKEGFIGLRDFSGGLIQSFTSQGFIYHDRITIWKDPVVEMQRTKALGLLHKQVKKDSTMSRTGIPDYVLVFRKVGENPIPVTNTSIPVDLWQKYASPVWYDINYGNTLQRESARDQRDEKHICPLQLETIERAIHLWSNPGETVFSPFAGIGSEGHQALKMGRQFIGFELKESYFNIAMENLRNATDAKSQLKLFA